MSASSISIVLALTIASPIGGAQPLSLHHRLDGPKESEPAAVDEGSEREAAADPTEAETNPNASILEARSARGRDANAGSWEREGDELAAKGERAGAIAAYTEARSRATDEAAIVALDEKIAEVYARPSGELPGTQVLEAGDASEQEGPAPDGPSESSPTLASSSADADAEAEPVIKKWYFWVTVVAITASAGAIAGIASKAAIDERKAARAGSIAPPAGTVGQGAPALFRF